MRERWVVRIWCYTGVANAERVLGYMTKDGKATTDPRWNVATFDYEGLAWDFLCSSGNYGHDQDGDWCWPELLSLATECTT